MHKDELARQIAKYKARRLKTKLAKYGALTSVLLLFSLFADGATINDLYPFCLALPLPIYFLRESLKLARKSRKLKLKLLELQTSLSDFPTRFSFVKFITQPTLSFRLTLILFLLVIFTSLAATRVTPKSTAALIAPYSSATNH